MPEKLTLAVGEVWFVKMPRISHNVIKVLIKEATQSTVVLKRLPDLDDGIFEQSWRSDRDEVRFLERVSGKGPETVTSE